jgi:membrane protein insertase Oxa1/YidC/SpoIIIJ
LLLFPIARKSYLSMAKMKAVAPEIKEYEPIMQKISKR